MKKCFITLVALLCVHFAWAQKPPIMLGFSKMTFLVSSSELAKSYYGDYLGFDKAFEYKSSDKKTVEVYKINDRQFLEFIVDPEAKSKKRLVSITIQTPDVEQMAKYIKSKGAHIMGPYKDGAGNNAFNTTDNRGVVVEFADMNDQSLYAKTKGKFLSPRRISERMHHVGLHLNDVTDRQPFWVDILGFKELVRIPADKTQAPSLVYWSMPDNTECIEAYSSGAGAARGENFEHPCFLTMDMQATMDILRERDPKNLKLALGVGRTNRFILNIANTDGTKVEFTEPYTIK